MNTDGRDNAEVVKPERLGLIGRLFVLMRQSRGAEVIELVMGQQARI